MLYNYVFKIEKRFNNVNLSPLTARFNNAPLPLQHSGFPSILPAPRKNRKLAHDMDTYI